MPECAIMGAIHISKCLKADDILVKDDICNWGPYCGIVDKIILFKNPIFTYGHIALNWSFESAEVRNKKFNKFEGKFLKKI